jgi:hypothetical protein
VTDIRQAGYIAKSISGASLLQYELFKPYKKGKLLVYPVFAEPVHLNRIWIRPLKKIWIRPLKKVRIRIWDAKKPTGLGNPAGFGSGILVKMYDHCSESGD